jgi:hypothetical protein
MLKENMQKIGEKITKQFGTFEFFLKEDDQVKLVCAHGGKTAETTYVGNIKGHNAMNIESLGVKQNGKTMMFIGLPDEVYNAFQNAKSNFALKNIHLTYAGRSAETGIKFYRLSAEVPRDVWRKISKYFEKFYPDEEDALDGELIGWLTAQPEAVEKILNVREELTLAYRRREAEKRREEKKKKANELQAKIDDIKKAFENAEYPDPKKEAPEEAAEFMKGYEKMRVEGEEIQHPTNPENAWGGGEWWVIQPEWIWHVRNNGFDGDDWSRNNIHTGGAGAIGVRVPFSEDLAAQIRGLKK